MKFATNALLFLSTIGAAVAQMDDSLENAYKLMRASSHLDAAIESLMAGESDQQPTCGDPTKNYVMCLRVEDDIDDTVFVEHPIVPEGTTLGALKGTPDYDLGRGMVEAQINAVGDCADSGKFGLAKYEWLDDDDQSRPIMATTLVKDFVMDGKTYVCSSGPLRETPMRDNDRPMEKPMDMGSSPDTLITTSPHLNDMIPEFEWSEAPAGSDYDFEGFLEFCGGKANKIEWPEYFLEQNISQAIFAYRQFGKSTSACGDDMAPLMRLQPGKVYKINFINTSESDTNLHTHGIHIGGNGYSDDVTRLVRAGMCGVYFWEVIDNHMAGMHWYHPHAHEWTFEQVRGRAFGPLWVEEEPERFATYPPSVQEWLKSTILIQMSSETVPGPMSGGDGVKDGRCPGGREVCYPRANNKRTETVPMTKGEWKSVVFNMIVPNGTGMDVIQFYDEEGIGDAPCEILIAGYDGVYRSKVPRLASEYPEKPGFFHINGASRMQLAMKCSDNATMKLAKFDSTPQHYSIDEPEVPILVIFDVTDGPITIASPYADEATMTQWIPPRPEYLEDLTGWDGEVETWDLITEVLMEPFIQPVFNGQVFHGGAPNYVGTYGAVQEWSFYGSAGAPEGHPMHVHVNHMQILGHSNITGLDCGSNMEFGEWYDTIRVDDESHDPCMARFRFNNYSGKVILHCHDLMHEDAGMMGLVMVEGGPQDPFATDDPAPDIDCINIL